MVDNVAPAHCTPPTMATRIADIRILEVRCILPILSECETGIRHRPSTVRHEASDLIFSVLLYIFNLAINNFIGYSIRLSTRHGGGEHTVSQGMDRKDPRARAPTRRGVRPALLEANTGICDLPGLPGEVAKRDHSVVQSPIKSDRH